MSRIRYTAETIIAKLRKAEVEQAHKPKVLIVRRDMSIRFWSSWNSDLKFSGHPIFPFIFGA